MSKRITSLFLALIMILQILIPQNIFAEEEKNLPQDKYVKVGMIDGKSYDAKIMNELNRIAAKNRKQGPINIGTSLFSSGPYFGDNNEPKDADKPKYFGNVSAKLDLVGLDGNPFQWNEIFGVDESGNSKPAQIIFRQMDAESSVDTGLYYMLQITKEGKYTWSDGEGKPTKLPLFSKSLKPYKYEVRIDERVSDKVKLLTEVIFGTEGSSPTFSPENADGEIIANITLGLTYQQIASTKFKSEWHTGVAEAKRPDIKANFAFDDEGDGLSPVSVALPKNDKDTKIIRDWYNEFDPDLVISYYLEKTPDVKIDETTAGLTFDTANKTVSDGNHKFKYDFKYDVINGGKLTMREVIPVTFDANGGKFASITDENAEQKIVKEVDYDGTLTDKAENPTKDRETFKGWSETKGGKTPVTDEVFKNIKEAKTFYAIWDNNDIVADELEVKESFKDGDTWVNYFIPKLEILKGQVKIKDANGDPQPLETTDTFAIVDGTNEYKTDADAKNYLYDKLKEKDNPNDEPTRIETVKAKVTHKNGTIQTVDISIKVIKNIYEAKTLTEKPFYVPKEYVKVTLDPTTKATDPQKTYYYVNPAAKVIIPGSNPTGTGDNVFTKWLIDGTNTEYKLEEKPRYQFSGETTIKAQYEKQGKGIIKIAYVDENDNEISADYHIEGVDYPSEKEGKLGTSANETDYPKPGPDFKGYIYDSRDSIKGKQYKDSAYPDKLDTVTYKYTKKVTTDDKSQSGVYFPVVFDANKGAFTGGETKVTVYVYFNGNDATVEKVTFKEVREAVEEKYGEPSKANENFIEWQDKVDKGSAVADNYEIQFKGWDSEYNPTGDTFYAHYGKASALISYLDLDGKEIDAKFKFISTENGKDVDGEGNKLTFDKKYPTEKEGQPGKEIESNVFTKDNAPTLIGYKFNRIEINPKGGKYALDNKATIKIYYGKLPDIIPSTGNDKPDGYVTVTFEPGTNGTLDGETKFYVNPKADPAKTMAEITQPTIKANQGFKVADPKWKDAEDNALATATKITKDLTYTAQYETLNDIIKDPTPEDNSDKPDGYVTVTFKPGDHGKLDNDTKDIVYYVNPKADPVKTMNDITEPTVTPNTNYEVDTPNWKDADGNALDKTTEIKADLTYTAQYKFTKDVVPQGPGEGKPVVPDNYVKVTFKEGEHGVISASQTTIYWVNPEKVVDLTDKAPKVKADPEYKHTGWDKELKAKFATATDITAKYLKKVETTNPEDTENYVKVDFKAETHGNIKAGETSVYWVLKNEIVELKTPAVEAKANYAFKEWKEPVKTSYNTDTTHKAVFAYTGDNVVPQTGTEKPDVPENFVEVVFDKGTNGDFVTGAITTYWVNPDKQVTVTAPKVEANEGWKHVAWTYKLKATDTSDKEVTTLESVTDTFTEKVTTITAKYLKKVLEEKPTTDTDAYVEVKFNAESNGKLPEDKTVKSYWVLKDTPVKFDVPTVTANPGWKFIKYDPAVKDSYSEDTVHKAQYKKIIETEDPKDKDYVKVTFDPAAQGTIKTGSNAEVWVLKDVTIDPTAITPQLEVKTGYAFKEWTPAVKDKYTEDTKHVASYTYNGDDVVPQKPGEDKPNVPNNFVKVTFVTGEHGSISNTETYIFWVNPEKEVTLNAPKVTVNADYKHMAWTYKLTPSATVDKEVKTLESVTDKFTEKETTITAKYLEKVVTENPNDTENYVKVTFKADADDQSPARGTLTGTTTYWVLKNTDVTVPAPKVTPNSGYTFTVWAPPVKTNYDVDTTHTAQYKAKDKIIEDPTTPEPNPGYVRLTFDATGDGKIGKNQEKYIDVLEGTKYKDTDLQNLVKKIVPTYKDNTKVFNTWNPEFPNTDTDVAKSTYTATYKNAEKIIDKDPTTPGEIDDNYIRFVFDANTKDNKTTGKIGENQKVIFDVLKGTRFSDSDLQTKIDGIKPVADNAKLKFNVWDPSVLKDNTLVENAKAENGMSADGKTITYNATYVNKDKIIDVTPGTETEEPKPDYVRFIFNAVGKDDKNADVSGKVKGNKVYAFDVLKGTAFNDTDLQDKVKDLKAIADANNYKFEKWNPEVKNDATLVEAGEGGTEVTKHEYTAVYKELPKIIENPTTEKPDPGYVRLTFDATDAGRIGTADGEQKKVIDVLKGTPYTDTDLKAKLDEIKAVPVKDEDGNAVADKEKTFDKWTPAVPTTGYVKTETFTASYKKFIPKQEKIDITATKTWQDAEGNTPNFTTPEVKFELWRKAGQAGTEEIVKEATALTNNSVTFSKVDKYDANGAKYIYFVKEIFTNPTEKDNWNVSGEGTLNLTNKLKGDSTDPGTDKGGKLIITKKLENEPVALKSISMMRAPAPAASEPLKFKFKVTGPYGYSSEFELAANESKVLDKLAYGDYTVEETDSKGYTPEYSKAKETLTKDSPNGIITVTNKNVKSNDPQNPNIPSGQVIDVTVKKVWENVPQGTTTPQVKIELWRKGYDLNDKKYEQKVGEFTTAANNTANEETHEFTDLAKQDPSGRDFTYYAVEPNVPENYTKTENGLTVTNTYHAPEVKFTVTYLPGSSTARGTMAADTDARGTYTVKANGFTNDGYTFKGWKVGNTTQIIQPGDTINVTANVTLTAQWEKTTTPPTPDPDNPNPDKPNPWDPNPWNPDYPKPWNPNYPDRPYIPRYPEIRYETIVQEKIVKVPVPIADNAYIKEVRYMQGFMGDFRPKDGLTRAEAAQILANALVEDGYKYNKDFKLPYKDIGEAWYTRAVKIVTEAKVFAGYDDGNFKPQDKITRNEWIATLKRFQELGDVSGNHMKLKDGHWAMAEIEAAYKEGWLKIYSDGLATYEGDKFIPREEVAAVSNKAFNRVLDKTYIINNDKNLITYKDVKKDMWSYEDILCASNTFLYKKDLYRAHWIKEDNNQFNINTDGFEIVKAKFQRNPR